MRQSIVSTFQPHHASAYVTGVFPENTFSAEGGLSTANPLVLLLAAGSAEAGGLNGDP